MSQQPFVLLITSEELNPQNIYSSCFELNLAKCLQKEFEVGVFSVHIDASLIGKAKQFFKAPSLGTFKNVLIYLFQLLTEKVKIKTYLINQVSVQEVVGKYWYSGAKTPLSALNKWSDLGMKGFFKAYIDTGNCPVLVHAHSRFLVAGFLSYQIKLKFSIPYIYSEHSSFYHRGKVDQRLLPYIKKSIDHADYFTAVSNKLYNTVLNFIGSINNDVKIMHNVLDNCFQVPLNRTNLQQPVLINIASLDQNKNQVALIKAIPILKKKYPHIQLQLVGIGADKEKLSELVIAENLGDTVQFLGQQTSEQVKKLLDAADLFVLPSFFETFGVAVIEALARGVPVVVTKCGGSEEYFEEFTGKMIESFDPDSLARGISEVLENYELYSSNQIRNYSLSKFGTAAILKEHSQLYYQVINLT